MIGPGALTSAAEVFEQAFGDQSVVIVANENTFDVVGREVQQHLTAAHFSLFEPFIFPGQPQLHADYEQKPHAA